MEIDVLGAHNLETATTKMVSLLVDDVLALDAGGLAGSLSLSGMEKLAAVFVTHAHSDHIKDLAGLALHRAFNSEALDIYALPEALGSISAHVFNGTTFPRFDQIPSADRPAVRFCPVEPYQPVTVNGLTVMAVPVKHTVTAVAFQVTSHDGKSVLYSGDTGPGCVAEWADVSPQVLIMDTTFPDSFTDFAISVGHMTPALLKAELSEFLRLKRYLPPVVLIHLMPQYEERIREEVERVAQELEARIEVAYEGMRISL